MALFHRDNLIQLSDEAIRRAPTRTDSLIEMRKAASAPEWDTFDVFICHSSDDAKVIHGLMLRLQGLGLKVYVDWVVDPQLDRSSVTSATADRLRKRMRNSASLLYAASESASNSKWTPWELGYSDALHGRVGVVPITPQATTSDQYQGQEYLGLYPYLVDGSSLWMHASQSDYVSFLAWLREGAKPRR